MPTWLITLDADGVATNVIAEPEFAWASVSNVVVGDVVGTMANAFEENESDREPSKSISTLFEVAGAAEAAWTAWAVWAAGVAWAVWAAAKGKTVLSFS